MTPRATSCKVLQCTADPHQKQHTAASWPHLCLQPPIRSWPLLDPSAHHTLQTNICTADQTGCGQLTACPTPHGCCMPINSVPCACQQLHKHAPCHTSCSSVNDAMHVCPRPSCLGVKFYQVQAHHPPVCYGMLQPQASECAASKTLPGCECVDTVIGCVPRLHT